MMDFVEVRKIRDRICPLMPDSVGKPLTPYLTIDTETMKSS